MRLTLRLLLNSTGNYRSYTKRAVCKKITDDINKYAAYNPTILTLDNFVKFANKKSPPSKSFSFLSKELPVRLANIMKEFHLLPDQLHYTPSFQIVEEWYENSFNDIMQFKDENPETEGVLDRFNATLAAIYHRHTTVVETMAQGVMEMKETQQDGEFERQMQKFLQYFLDRFYLNRIGIRMLISQHLLMFTDLRTEDSHIGAIDQRCDVMSIAEDAFNNARFLCEQYYMASPLCEFDCRSPFTKELPENRITMTYVPTHLYHMLFEIFKNSLRAVVEHYDGRNDLPPINVLICKGRSDITIKVSDLGGGIRRSDLGKLFSYMYSTAPKPGALESAPLAGYGYGLPLSHLYAKYFNGDLWLNSIDGYGTDAMICLKLYPCDASELQPVYNNTCRQKYVETDLISDWSDPLQSLGVDGARPVVGN